MESKDIALMEFGGSHDECLYSQVMFLNRYGYRVHLLIKEDHFAGIEAWPEVPVWKTFPAPRGFAGKWKLAFRVLKYLRNNNIHQAIINTAEGNIIRAITMISGKDINFTGLLHTGRKLWTSRSQRIINRKIRKYFVLADFIRENLDRADPHLSIEYFYPVYFPESRKREMHEKSIRPVLSGTATPDPRFLVCIPGAVDFARRDYLSLIREIDTSGVPREIRFLLLGRTTGPDGRLLVSRIRELGLEEYFTYFDEFLEHAVFYDYLSRSSLILPLITPGALNYEDYLKYKITGTYNLAWGFQIPMLMHESFMDYPIFGQTSAFYRSGELIKTLESLAGETEKLREIREKIPEIKDFDFTIQAERYVQFVRSEPRSQA